MPRRIITVWIALAVMALGCDAGSAANAGSANAAGARSNAAGSAHVASAGAENAAAVGGSGGVAAGPPTPTHEGDPGAPAIEAGPKAAARLSVAGTDVGVGFFTALAPKQGERSHLFARPWPSGSMGVTSFYVSVVMDSNPWRVGSYTGALAGKVSFVLSDGRHYSGEASELDAKGTIEVVGDSDPKGYYLRGALDLTVPSEELGAPPLAVHIQINDSKL
jgi:hypothetical protein